MLHTAEVASSPQAHVPGLYATPHSGGMTATPLQLRYKPRQGGGAAHAQHTGAVSLPQRRVIMMRKSSLTLALLLVVLVPILLLGTGSGRADDRDHGQREGPVRLLKTIPIPGTAANATNGKLYS